MTANLTAGTHYYVCTPHAYMGMKASIIVQNVTPVIDNKLFQEVSVYPNPVTDKLTVQSADQSLKIVGIYDVSGKLLFQTEGNGLQQEIELSDFNAGVYILRVKTSKETFTGRIIKK